MTLRLNNLRPADGAVAGAVAGAVVFGVFLNLVSGGVTPSRVEEAAIPATSTTASDASSEKDDTSTSSTKAGKPDNADATSASPTSSPRPSSVEIAPSTTTAAPAAQPATTAVEDVSSVDALIRQLRVEPERPRSGYDRDLFDHWITQSNGCSTREQVLINESRTPPQVDPYGCEVLAGDWISAYDGYSTDDPGELDIDHVVALGEAWDSGADGWSAERRRQFANDLDHPGSLIAVTASTNRSKSDRDPSSWQPPNSAAWCQFATDWTRTKIRWDLSADQSEVDALRNIMRAGCGDGEPSGSST